ncbi:type II toxin-antitoxin system VapB family antitoxin [Acidobacteria bacterium AH-259-D05]|nr:type II toxin-antitoxin system VapB family antitoxin [Acidobacteria bacterium AH-259-D05]
MVRFSVTLDSELLEEARELGNLETKRETIERALREFIVRRRLRELQELEGSGLVDMELDELQKLRKVELENA